MLPYAYQVTKYDPADRNEHRHYQGAVDSISDHGPLEAAYLEAVAAFAEDSGVTELEIREPGVAGRITFGREAPIEGDGLIGLFPDRADFHDGAVVPVPVGVALVRAMLRDHGAWCRLEVEGRFFAHVGYDQYLFVGSTTPCERAIARVTALGLFVEPIDHSPYDIAFDEVEPQRPADDAFWAEVAALCPVTLEEGYLTNASRWHRVGPADVDDVRARLAPRSWLMVWPELAPVDSALASLPEGCALVVREDADGSITCVPVEEEDYAELPAYLSGARAALVHSGYAEVEVPLLTAVLPDADGVVRARWAASF
ncbi:MULTISPECIES: RNA-binding protein [Actinosynnema]|uniref:RNA-binding protein n=1 Tax=Actinosynnema TaxID=40566 RepID=UPI0031E3AC13|nr:hypothetical protein [Actinosynnema pretiosum]